jgi:hypothetical protein
MIMITMKARDRQLGIAVAVDDATGPFAVPRATLV